MEGGRREGEEAIHRGRREERKGGGTMWIPSWSATVTEEIDTAAKSGEDVTAASLMEKNGHRGGGCRRVRGERREGVERASSRGIGGDEMNLNKNYDDEEAMRRRKEDKKCANLPSLPFLALPREVVRR